MKTITLNNKATIPVLGFGTWQLTGEDCVKGVSEAISLGYRHIDTADAYGNHIEVAEGIAQAGVAREELFITTKIFNDDHAHDDVIATTQRFLQELQTDYIDLLLIHWPNKKVPIAETLQAMNELKASGVVRALGVSNFTQHHIEDALETGVEIVNNQIETHPQFNQAELRAFCTQHNISVTAYSPLARGEALKIPLLQELAEKYSVTTAQIIIAWCLSQDMITIPKSATPARIKENIDSLNIELSEEDIQSINNLEQTNRLINPGFNEFDY